MPNQALPVSVIFCQTMGFIPFTITCLEQSIELYASELYDPIPSLVKWLEAISIGVERCSFDMDEEGAEKRLIFEQGWRDAHLTVCCPYDESDVYLRVQVNPVQVVAEFYNNLRRFALSADYDKEKWERETLRDRLVNLTDPPNHIAEVENALMEFDRDGLKEILFKVAPSYTITFPDVDDEQEHWTKTVAYMSDKDNPEAANGMVEKPNEWHVDENYDQMSSDQKLLVIRDRLNCCTSDFHGCHLADVRSQLVEDWLRQHIQSAPTKVISIADRRASECG